MLRSTQVHISLAILIALAALFLTRVHNAGGSKLAVHDASEGHRLADSWCKAVSCYRAAHGGHVGSGAKLDRKPARNDGVFAEGVSEDQPPEHAELVIAPDQADALANYILSLKTN